VQLLEDFTRLDNWNDTSVYKGKEGRVIPEKLYFMLAIKSYHNQKEKDEIDKVSSGGGKGNKGQHPSDYEREF